MLFFYRFVRIKKENNVGYEFLIIKIKQFISKVDRDSF